MVQKKRALENIGRGDLQNAYGSMISDLSKHPETGKDIGIMLGMNLMINGHLNTPRKMTEYINGFN